MVNYNLPWNLQRIEQRTGRCHRYGQKFDVVVVNFLNKNNAADQRAYQILVEKFRIFSGVFGASDEVLGSIESGVDFEKRIAQIYQSCRTPEEKIHPGHYRFGRNIEDVNSYRIGHPLAQRIIEQCKFFHAETTPDSQSGLIFNYSDTPAKIPILEPIMGKSG